MSEQMSREEETERWYREYYTKHGGADRNSLLHNAGVLWQHLSAEWALLRALQSLQLEQASTRVLDVGTGSGGSLLPFLLLDFPPQNLYGIDIQSDRIAEGQRRFPSLNLQQGDATSMEYPDSHFHVVMESSMFIQITDDTLASSIAAEMMRVTMPNGHIILVDWRYDGGRSGMKKLGLRRIESLFGLGRSTELVGRYPGCLIPPVGRFLSSRMPSLYMPVSALLPPLVGLMVHVLRKNPVA